MSVYIGTSCAADIPALKVLWKQAFGDDDACIDTFFETAYLPDGVFVLKEGGQVQAMACWFPMTICWEKRGWGAAYLYAVATDAAARGRGFCGRLLAFAEDFLRPKGIKVLTLVPGTASLRQFYERHGYADCSAVTMQTIDLAPADGTAEEISAPAYLALREDLLQDRAYVSCPVPVLAFQERIARLYDGALLRLEADGLEGCACVARNASGCAVIYELLWPGDTVRGAALAAQFVGAQQALVRTPGEDTPFAMAKWLTEKPEIPAPYFGIALD